jgi:hypothetical protein
MKKERITTYSDNFNKKEGTFLYDDKKDEVMLNVLELYPDKLTYFFNGSNGEEKKKALQARVRDTFNQMESDYENAFGDKLFGKGKAAKLRDKLKKVGNVIKTASLSPARGAALALIRLNFRGNATRLANVTSEGSSKIKDKWKKLGGNPSKLQDAIDAGKKKPIIVCGKKCRAKAGKNPQIPSSSQSDFVNVAGGDDAAVAALIAAGGKVVAALIGLVASAKFAKDKAKMNQLDKDLAQKDKEENSIDATMTSQEKKIADEIIKAQSSGFDPIAAIQNNPNLTAEEKEAAISQLNVDLGKSTGINKNFIFIGLGLIAVGAIIYTISKKSE